ncbi:unnamed protein product [Clonostachys rosea f. rosea IK726]|uniref:Uncharacterized protein n=2 Tax=Bionectria ochroleuca TaxID=29856 RepID=A0A0B7KLN9_BIOOC|nr:unnamed protein product [Clonostachys rosea f. rosea IK726]
MRFFTIAITSFAACAYAIPQLTGGMRVTDTSNQPRDQQGTDEINIPEHFACTADSDCVIRNVGNCCGYYPKCANADAELPDPCPGPGMAGVCGFPTIDSCKCGSHGGCISLQGETTVHGHQFDDSNKS